MKCPACEGTGIIHFRNIHELCGKCKGIGYIDDKVKPKKQKTEQEWLQTADTEQLAEEISYLVFGGDFKKHISKMGYINMHSYKTEIVEWLKQPHKPIS